MKTQKTFYCVLVLSVLALTTPAHAADERGLYQALNYISCQQFHQDRKLPVHTGRNAADEIYISGWLSAYNYLTPSTYDIVPGHDIANVMSWMDAYCNDNPSKGIEAGLLQFIADKFPERTQLYVAPNKPAAQ